MLQAHPEAELSDVQLAGLHSLYNSYAVQRIGPSLLDCDFAFYPCCNDAHWFLFILDIKQQKLLLIDPLAEWGDSLKSIYSRYIYAMVFYVLRNYFTSQFTYTCHCWLLII